MGFKVAVVGATGNVGREMLSILAERKFPAVEVHAVASERSAGTEVSFGDDDVLKVRDLDTLSISSGVDIALFSPGAKVSAVHAPRAAKAGAVVIDNTSHFRMDKDVPLVVPEVNPEAIAHYDKRGIIANPNCSTIQMVVALKPLHDLARIRRVVVATYQSVSGAGREAMDELFTQTRGIYVNDPDHAARASPSRSPSTAFPISTSSWMTARPRRNGRWRARRARSSTPTSRSRATCVRVPVFIGHAEAVNVEFERPISESEARAALQKAPGVLVVDHRADEGYVTPVEVAGEDAVYVSRIRRDTTVAHGLNLWVVADNLRKGAALNAVQIAEMLARDHLQSAQPAPPLRRLRRAWPASRARAAAPCSCRAPTPARSRRRAASPADVLIFDLEDAVAPARKPGARAAIVRGRSPMAAMEGASWRSESMRRATQWAPRRSRGGGELPLDAVLLPKVESAETMCARPSACSTRPARPRRSRSGA